MRPPKKKKTITVVLGSKRPEERVLELVELDEDEGDYLVSRARELVDAEIPLEDVLKRYGRSLDGKTSAPRQQRSRRTGAKRSGERPRRSGRLSRGSNS